MNLKQIIKEENLKIQNIILEEVKNVKTYLKTFIISLVTDDNKNFLQKSFTKNYKKYHRYLLDDFKGICEIYNASIVKTIIDPKTMDLKIVVQFYSNKSFLAIKKFVQSENINYDNYEFKITIEEKENNDMKLNTKLIAESIEDDIHSRTKQYAQNIYDKFLNKYTQIDSSLSPQNYVKALKQQYKTVVVNPENPEDIRIGDLIFYMNHDPREDCFVCIDNNQNVARIWEGTVTKRPGEESIIYFDDLNDTSPYFGDLIVIRI